MKRGNLIIAALAALMFSSCVQVCVETERRYAEAPKKYPDLIPFTVNELASKIQSDGKDYKIVYIYDGCDNMFGRYISQSILPYVRNHPELGIGVYTLAGDCGWLEDIKPVFGKYNIDLPGCYIRDNSPEFINHGKNRINDLPGNRLTRIANRLFVNAGNSDLIRTRNTCYVVNSENKIKLARYTCRTRQGVKSVVVPCPIERITEPLDKIDFDSVIEIEQSADDSGKFTETDENDGYIHLIYFSQYNK